jgi:pimeloyl-ACP methyl ester carboxylesterase
VVAQFDQTLFPFAPHFFDRGAGVRMHYVDEGAGPPVVCVHGNPTWSFYYRNVIQALKVDHRVLAPDHVGMGLSDKPDDAHYAYTLQNRVDDFTHFIKSLDLKEKLTLVVHDWGGMIGFAWAVQHPDQVKKLVVLNTGAFPLPDDKQFPWQLALTRTPLGALLVRGFNAFSKTSTHLSMTQTRMPENVRQAYIAPYDTWANRIATLRFVQDIPLQPGAPGFNVVKSTADELGNLAEVPMFIGWGGKDFVFDDAFLRVWQAHFPKADLFYYADAGHYVLEDAAADLVPRIAAFIRAE